MTRLKPLVDTLDTTLKHMLKRDYLGINIVMLGGTGILNMYQVESTPTIRMYSRGFRGSRRRSSPRAIIKSYKKVIFLADAGFTAGFHNDFIASGIDAIAAGQTSATDINVPTGSIIKQFEVQFACSNIVSGNNYVNCSIQYALANQSHINPDVVGGNSQRNQVLHMDNFSVGADQNSTHKFKFKIPKKFQRLREGMVWSLVWSNNASLNRQTQIIYKFYQ